MKKMSILVTAIVLASAINANASEFYTGVTLGSSSNSLKTEDKADLKYYEKSGIVSGIFAGHKLRKDLAIEIGANQFSVSKKLSDEGEDVNVSTKLKLINYSVDAIKTFDLDSEFSLFASAGLSVVKGSLKENVNLISDPSQSVIKNSNEAKLGYSIGGGIAYHLSENVDLRAKIKYTKLGMKFSDSFGVLEVKDMVNTTVDLAYNF